MTFLQSIQSEESLCRAISNVAKSSQLACFADLIWPGDSLDPFVFCADPGVEFVNGDRVFVLMRVNEEIRYFAGSADPNNVDLGSEIGGFSTLISALQFGIEFLVNGCPFSGIRVPRNIKW